MSPPAVGNGTLRRLNGLSGDGQPILSVYLDLGSANGRGGAADCTARDTELQTLIASAGAQIQRAGVERVHELLRSMREPAYGTRGLALFSSADGSAFEAVALPSAVRPMAVVDTLPWLEPLAAIFATGDWGVALITSRATRLFRGGPRTLVEFADLHARLTPPQGGRGWPSARSPRAQQLRADHARGVARRLLRAHERQVFDHLMVIDSSGLWPAIEAALHGDLRARLAAVIQLDLEDVPPREVVRTLTSLIERAQQEQTPGSQAPPSTADQASSAAIAPPRREIGLLRHFARIRVRRPVRLRGARAPRPSAPRPAPPLA